jgi:hypothetical protein
MVESGKKRGWSEPMRLYGRRLGFTLTVALIRSRISQPLASSIPETVPPDAVQTCAGYKA